MDNTFSNQTDVPLQEVKQEFKTELREQHVHDPFTKEESYLQKNMSIEIKKEPVDEEFETESIATVKNAYNKEEETLKRSRSPIFSFKDINDVYSYKKSIPRTLSYRRTKSRDRESSVQQHTYKRRTRERSGERWANKRRSRSTERRTSAERSLDKRRSRSTDRRRSRSTDRRRSRSTDRRRSRSTDRRRSRSTGRNRSRSTDRKRRSTDKSTGRRRSSERFIEKKKSTESSTDTNSSPVKDYYDTFRQKYSKEIESLDKPSPMTMFTDRLEKLEKTVNLLLQQRTNKPMTQTVPDAEPYYTTSMWLNQIQDEAIANNWNDAEIVFYMQTKMTGLLRNWYENLPKHDYSWHEWRVLISKSFPDHTDFALSLKRLIGRLKLPDESMMQYYFSKLYLLETCKITGRNAVSCLIDGLNNIAVQEEAKSSHFVSPDELYTLFLITLPDNLGSDSLTETNDESSFASELEQQNGEEREITLQQSPEKDQKSKSNHRSISPPRGATRRAPTITRIKCTVCSKYGHPSQICRFRKGYNPSYIHYQSR